MTAKCVALLTSMSRVKYQKRIAKKKEETATTSILPTARETKNAVLVLLLQQHKHSSYCKRNKKCRFNFPKPPSCKTLITKDDTDPDDIKQALAVLSKVQKLIAEGEINLSLNDLLDKAKVTENEYIDALEVSSTGNVVVLKRDPDECFINNCNPSVMLAWQANMNILNAYACVMYVASYTYNENREIHGRIAEACSR